MHKLRLLRIFLLSLFATRPTDMLHPVTYRELPDYDVSLFTPPQPDSPQGQLF